MSKFNNYYINKLREWTEELPSFGMELAKKVLSLSQADFKTRKLKCPMTSQSKPREYIKRQLKRKENSDIF